MVALLKDLVLVAGWMHTFPDLSLQSVDMQLCDNNVAILFKVSSDSLSEFGIGEKMLCTPLLPDQSSLSPCRCVPSVV